MEERKSVTISHEMYLIIQGQIGNIGAELEVLQRQLAAAGLTDPPALTMLLAMEVHFLQRYLPRDPDELQLRIAVGGYDVEDGS